MPAPKLLLAPPVAYILSVVFDKGFSLLTIPLTAGYLRPGEYGRFDVAVSLIEFASIVLSFGMSGTLIRFASTARDAADQKRCSAELMTVAALIALVAGSALQIAVPWLIEVFNISVGTLALRCALVGATLTALIDMPLVWLRMRGRAEYYLLFVVVRSVVQVLLMWSVLLAGWGADGILIANAAAIVLLTVIMAGQHIRQTGLGLSMRALHRVGTYGGPLVGAALAMFALGSCNRLFLSGQVSDSEIAFLALANKLALAAPLLLQPFDLWWGPRRIAALGSPDGLAESARAFGLGYSMLVVSAMSVALAGPVFIDLTLPVIYGGAAAYLPFVVLICFLNELNSLCNTGAYARGTGYGVLSANGAGALVAIAGYWLLTPSFGVHGVIAAMVAGHLVRLGIFQWIGYAHAPIAYPVGPAALTFVLAAAAVWLAPTAIASRIAWSGLALALVCGALVAQRLLIVPESLVPRSLRRSLAVVPR